MIRTNRKTKRCGGFAMAEAVLSVFVLATGLTAAVGLVVGNMNESIDSRNEIIASELAQEGVEIVRNIRDNNLVDDNAFFGGFTGDNYFFRVDRTNSNSPSYSSNDSSVGNINWDDFRMKYAGGWYAQSDIVSGPYESFKRAVQVQSYNGGEGKIITSFVIWGDINPSGVSDCGAASKCVYAQSILTDR